MRFRSFVRLRLYGARRGTILLIPLQERPPLPVLLSKTRQLPSSRILLPLICFAGTQAGLLTGPLTPNVCVSAAQPASRLSAGTISPWKNSNPSAVMRTVEIHLFYVEKRLFT